jgi:hypothetical protein
VYADPEIMIYSANFNSAYYFSVVATETLEQVSHSIELEVLKGDVSAKLLVFVLLYEVNNRNDLLNRWLLLNYSFCVQSFAPMSA